MTINIYSAYFVFTFRRVIYIFCVFIGNQAKNKIKKYLKAVLKDIYKYERHIKCLICDLGEGSFERMAEEAVRELKEECPEIELCIVMPILPLEDEFLELLDKKTEGRCDSVIIPDAWLAEAGIYDQIRQTVIEQMVLHSDKVIISTPITMGFLNRMVKLAKDMGIEVHNVFFDMLNDSEHEELEDDEF